MLKILSNQCYKYNFNNNVKLVMKHTSSSRGITLCVPSTSTITAACLIGHTRNLLRFLGWNWTFNIGEGNLYFWSHSPDKTSHIQTLLSVDALNNLCPFLDQLIDKNNDIKLMTN